MDNNNRKLEIDASAASIAEKLCVTFGATHEEIAAFFEISGEELTVRANESPELKRALRIGAVFADANVAERLYRLCAGDTRTVQKRYVRPGSSEVTVIDVEEYTPPNADACRFWLANRQPDQWREFVENGTPFNFS